MPPPEPPFDVLGLLCGVAIFLAFPIFFGSLARQDLRATASWKCLPRLVAASLAMAGLFMLGTFGTAYLAGNFANFPAHGWLEGGLTLLAVTAVVSSVCAWMLTQTFRTSEASFRSIVRWVFKHAPPQPEPSSPRWLFRRRTTRDRRT